jgi:hypothetical protein
MFKKSVRWITSAALIACVWKETGPFTAIVLMFVTIAIELIAVQLKELTDIIKLIYLGGQCANKH